MKWLAQFGKFWYDFLIGDDWRLAVGVVITISARALSFSAGWAAKKVSI